MGVNPFLDNFATFSERWRVSAGQGSFIVLADQKVLSYGKRIRRNSGRTWWRHVEDLSVNPANRARGEDRGGRLAGVYNAERGPEGEEGSVVS